LVLILVSACGKHVPATRYASSSPRRSAAATPASELQGLASYYAEPYTGRPTASGEIFDTYQDLTAAHRTLPFNTLVRVTNEENGRNVNVRINDRGPFVEGRVIDLSVKAARELDMVRAGLAPVKLTVLRDGADETPSATPRLEPPPPSSPPAGLFTIQVGAFGSEEAAGQLKKDLDQRYDDVSIQTFTTTRTFYRVRVGRLPDMISAETLMKQLRLEKFDPFVVRLN